MDERTLKALGDPKRYLLLTILSEHGYCVKALAHRSALSESAVSQHLKILREADLVYGVKFGYYTHYKVNQDTLGQIISELETLRRNQRKPCPFYGCSEAAAVRCKSYVAPEDRTEKEG